jgi:peptidoglycan/LPS O-acetylase OafA/YrhL
MGMGRSFLLLGIGCLKTFELLTCPSLPGSLPLGFCSIPFSDDETDASEATSRRTVTLVPTHFRYLRSMQRSGRQQPSAARRRSLIAFLGGLGLLAAALLATGVFPMISTVIAIIGVAAMIYGLAAGVMVVLNREDDGSPE